MGGWAGREEMDPRKEIRRQGGGELARDFFSIHREDVRDCLEFSQVPLSSCWVSFCRIPFVEGVCHWQLKASCWRSDMKYWPINAN